MPTPSTTARPLRADAQRDYDAIIRAAAEEVARTGAAASLEEIARVAGVGSATLHRHFPSRWALLQAIFKDQVRAFSTRAQTLADELEPGPALRTWLLELIAYSATTGGLVDAFDIHLAPEHPLTPNTCEAMLVSAGQHLLHAAIADKVVRPDITVEELLALVSAISLTTPDDPTPAKTATRLLTIALNGVEPAQDPSQAAKRT